MPCKFVRNQRNSDIYTYISMILSQTLFQNLRVIACLIYIFFLVVCKISYIIIVLSLIYLPDIKPFWSVFISFESTLFIRSAKMLERILYVLFSNDIGLQFFNNSRGLSPFGRTVITPCLCVVESSLVSNANFHERIRKIPMSFP